MKIRLAAAVVLVLGAFLAAPVQAAGRPEPELIRGVQVMPGGHVVEGRIVYEGGDVIVVPQGDPDSFDSCPSGYVCLFQDTSWQGTQVQFNSCCAWDNLSNYGFNDIASSWRNRLSVDAQIAKDSGGGSPRLCLDNNGYASSMPSGWDNVASSIRVRDASTYC